MSYGQKPFGLRDVKVRGASANAVDLPSAITLTFRERIAAGELAGDDKISAVAAYAMAVEWELSAGGISLEAYAELTGRSVATAGSTPNATKTLEGAAQQAFPYVKIYGKSIGDTTDDVHVKLWKAKVTSIEGSFQGGDSPQFFITSCSGVAIDDGSNGIFDIVQNETAANLPSS